MRIGVFLFLMMFALLPDAYAADSRFTVEVDVDVTDNNASLAREKAMTGANRAAFKELAKRITTDEGVGQLALLSDTQLVNFVKEVSVLSEKVSDVRYMAKLKVVVNEQLLKQYMLEKGIPLLVQTSSKVVIVPLYREAENAPLQLWEGTNLWRSTWAGNMNPDFVNIPDSGAIYATLDAAKAAAMDAMALDKVVRLNNADDVYVVTAVQGADSLKIFGASYNGDSFGLEILGAGGEAVNEAMRAVEEKISSRFRQQSIVDNASVDEVMVLYDFNSMADWVNTEKLLKSVPLVKDLRVEAMAAHKVQFQLVYIGDGERMLKALRAKSLYLIDHGTFYVLSKN